MAKKVGRKEIYPSVPPPPLFIQFLFILLKALNWASYPVADPDLELRRGPGFDLLALLPFSLLSFLLFLPKIRRGLRPPGPSPRSATATILYSSNHVQTRERFQGDQATIGGNVKVVRRIRPKCSPGHRT